MSWFFNGWFQLTYIEIESNQNLEGGRLSPDQFVVF